MAAVAFSSAPLLYSLVGGILPALLWLWFWTREDKLHPEPRARILCAFIGGMIAVALVYPVQRLAVHYLGGVNTSTLFAWAAIEELMKYVMVGILVLKTCDFDEPIDAMEYLITCALGFAALENTLFILGPFLTHEPLQRIFAVGNMRFIGASMLHVVCSGILGYCIGREFYRKNPSKTLWRVFGLILAIALHTIFNMFIIYENGSKTFLVFSCVWIATLVVLLLFEKVKKVQAK